MIRAIERIGLFEMIGCIALIMWWPGAAATLLFIVWLALNTPDDDAPKTTASKTKRKVS